MRASTRGKSHGLQRMENIWGLILCGPYVFGLLTFALGPILFCFLIGFTEWDNISRPRFIGFDNWTRLLGDGLFWRATLNTSYFVVGTVPVGVALSLALALMVNRPLRAIVVFRSLCFIPVVTSMVAVALVWTWFYDSNFGLLNFVIDRAAVLVGLPPPDPIAWLNNPATAMPAIIAMSIWKGLGYNMVIFLAALQTVPKDLYEAAHLDGAGRWRRFCHVTFPCISPATLFVIVINLIQSFQVFDQVYIMARDGRPANSTLTIVYHLYNHAFQYLEMGYASTIGTALFLMIMIVTVANLWAQKRWVHT